MRIERVGAPHYRAAKVGNKLVFKRREGDTKKAALQKCNAAKP